MYDTPNIGRGWAFPISITTRGGIALAGGSEDIDMSIYLILSTAPGERVMRPEFGCGIWSYVFEPIEPTMLGAIAHSVRESLTRWEPRITVEEVVAISSKDDEAGVEIIITFRIRSDNDRRNLVFPFYVIPSEVS